MIAAIMYSALGFLASMLLALLILPAVWRRAVRLTTRRIEGAIPVSIAEIEADKDQLRAEFAVSARRLERDSDLLRERTVAQFEQISRQSRELIALRAEIEGANARLTDYEAANSELAGANHRHVETLTGRERTLEELREERDNLRASLESAQLQLNDATGLSEGLRVEQVALSTTADSLRDEIADLRRDLAGTQARLADDRSALQQAVETLAAERSRTEELQSHLGAREADLDGARSEIGSLSTAIAALQTRTAELAGRADNSESSLGDARAEIGRINSEADAARRHAEGVARQLSDSLEMMRAEKKMMEDALAHAREDRARLAIELEALAAGAPASAAQAFDRSSGNVSDTAADAALRERIGDIAAEVVRITAALEGPDSPIEAILANGAANDGGAKGAAAVNPPTLADRIRAIQNRAR